MKGILKSSTLFIFMLVSVLFVGHNHYVQAGVSEAVQIQLNKTYYGTVTDYYDEDYYKFTLTSPGNVTLSLKNQADAEWYAKIQDINGNIYEDLYTDNSELVSGYSETQVGLPAGTYYIRVKNEYNAYGKQYQFKTSFTSSNNYEKEFNDSITFANPINLNESYKGGIRDYYDADFYKITLPKDGNIQLTMKQESWVSWYGHIQNSNGSIYESITTDDSELVEGDAVTQVGLPKGTYYIKIANDSNSYGTPYEFKVSYTASDYYEKEFNDNLTSADSMNLNQTYNGSLEDYNDIDIFKITLPSDGNVTLSLNQLPGSEWYVHIQNSTGSIYDWFYTDSSELVSGNATAQVGLPKGTYYIKVSNSDYAYDHPYKLKASFKASPFYEKEFNDSLTSATVTKLNNTYTGRISHSDDTDVYKVTVPTSGNVSLAFKQLPGARWYGHIQNSNGGVYTYFYTNDDELVSGYSYSKVWLNKGTYYFVVKNEYDSYNKAYDFKFYMKSNPVKAANVKVNNNKGKSDSVTVNGLAKGDVVKVYNASSKGTLLASATSTGTSATLSIKQVGTKSGKIYVSVTKSGLAESDRVAVTYKGEQANALASSQVKITNNKKKNDTIYVSKLQKNDVIKVYSASSGGKLLASSTSKGSSLTISLKQLGTTAGKVYISITPSGMLESTRTAISYSAEK
ncbi:pre-peptidase C-terminal domain-containing protein [Bacillus sp. NEB1478]|uniref:pre-peptidase C-terminal domain-containing protein n=1 Tax=Bacillus sp. NEB1478 TaxID=3073816 RepID=UPI0028731DAA|nr:pre-peptidase C-terminal domain-containing protein [Bacillus sp. NEB1478]WNB92513.1 hypothetical protein RGB74_02270 [Bacillus sp. NEB1478]